MTFNSMPVWFNSFANKTVSINSPELHYYSTRTENDQPVTLVVPSEDHQFTQIKMYYTIQKLSASKQLKQKDESPLKQYHVQYQEPLNEKIQIEKSSLKENSFWVVKYQPRRFIDLLSDEAINRNVLTWLKSWDQIVFKKKPKNENVHSFFKKNTGKPYGIQLIQQEYNYKKYILLAGPPGCGKTTLARVLARHSGYVCQQINASDDRSGNTLITKIQNFLTNKTIQSHQKPVCLIIDQVDGALDTQSNGMKNLLHYLQKGESLNIQKNIKDYGQRAKKQQKGNNFKANNLQKNNKWNNNKKQRFGKEQETKQSKQQIKRKIERPIIFICNDPFVKGLRQLRSKAIVVYMGPVTEQRIVRRLKDICNIQQAYVNSDCLIHISKLCGCDIRSSIGLLQLLVKRNRQSGVSPQQLLNKMKMTMSKDAKQNNSQFLLKLMSENKKNAGTYFKNIYNFTLNNSDNSSLLLTTLHHNLMNNKQIFLNMDVLTRLYRQICVLDSNYTNPAYLSQNSLANMLPYAYYKLKIPADSIKRIEFPMSYFQHYNNLKSKQESLTALKKNLPTNLSVFISQQSLVEDYLHLLWQVMQTGSSRQDEILKCVYKMIMYKFKLAHNHATHIFNPDIEPFLTFGSQKPQVTLSNISRNLIQQNYEFLSLKYDLISEGIGCQKQNLQTVINELKRNRKRKKVFEGNDIKYKFLQGTGTQIKYDLSIGYFFQNGTTNQ